MTDTGLVVCPHHGVPPDWNWEVHRVMGRLSITYRFPCCDYTLQVNFLPVPGIHEPLPDASCSHSVHAVGVGTLPLSGSAMSMTPSRRTVEAMTLGGMALDGRSLEVRCYRCRRTRKFLASDLAEVYGAGQSPHTLFGACSKCGSPVRVEFGFPKRGEMICRPKTVTKWVWRDEAWEPG